MPQQETVTLIHGQFSSEEAREILLNLFSAKIQFHQLKNFGVMERTGKPDPVAQQRIPELRKALEQLQSFINAAGRDEQLRLHANIQLTISTT